MHVLQFTGADGVPFDATLVLGRPGEAAPGVLFLHGGPHSAYPAAYLHALAFLASLGYNLVVPNYRCALMGCVGAAAAAVIQRCICC